MYPPATVIHVHTTRAKKCGSVTHEKSGAFSVKKKMQLKYWAVASRAMSYTLVNERSPITFITGEEEIRFCRFPVLGLQE